MREKRRKEEEQQREQALAFEMQEKERQMREEALRIKEEEERRQKEEDSRTILEINSYFEKYILKDTILLDSNIWMGPEYESFFIFLREQLRSNDKKIVLYGPQFDEICNIKKKTYYKTPKNVRSRIAINRIEDFQLNELLTIKPLTIDAERGAYADPLIIKMVLGLLENNEKVVFISDDKELRIRIRGLSEDKKKNCVVVPGTDLIDKAKSYCRIKNLFYEEQNIENYYSDVDAELDDEYDDEYEDLPTFQEETKEQWEQVQPKGSEHSVIYL